MKTLIFLSLLQTAILVLLFVNVLDADVQTTGVDDVGHAENSSAESSPSPSQDDVSTVVYYPNEEQLRRVIREELATQLKTLPAAVAQAEESSVIVEVQETPESWQRRESLAQRVEYFRSIRSISGAQMHDLVAEIGSLDEAGREHVMSALMTAINRGDISVR